MPKKYVGCRVMQVKPSHRLDAALTAIDHNPANRPRLAGLPETIASLIGSAPGDGYDRPEFLAVLTTKYWGAKGRKLGVSFVETTAPALRDRILSHMNAWYDQARANVAFAWSQSGGEIRISRGNGGYWSYLGTDILHIPAGQPTMNLEGFVLATSESEYRRVVRHETGHTLGFPHEHMRAEIVNRLNRQKTIDYFQRFQGWSPSETTEQVLTPLEESSIMGTAHAEVDSIMCYELPASITTDGREIPGGSDINPDDAAFAAKLYPREIVPPPPPPSGKVRLVVEFDGEMKNPKIVAG